MSNSGLQCYIMHGKHIRMPGAKQKIGFGCPGADTWNCRQFPDGRFSWTIAYIEQADATIHTGLRQSPQGALFRARLTCYAKHAVRSCKQIFRRQRINQRCETHHDRVSRSPRHLLTGNDLCQACKTWWIKPQRQGTSPVSNRFQTWIGCNQRFKILIHMRERLDISRRLAFLRHCPSLAMRHVVRQPICSDLPFCPQPDRPAASRARIVGTAQC